jgi:DNA-binding IscR family transcriptional regulator
MIRVITLLKQISNGSEIIFDAEDSADDESGNAILLDRLCSAGLIRAATENEQGVFCGRYELTRPLRQITLCDVLRLTNGEIHLCFEGGKDIYDRYGSAGRRLGVANYVTCHLLSEINLAEVVLPDADSEDKKESK